MSYVQVLGRLPFDEPNPRKRIQLMLSGQIFPVKEGSSEFRELVCLMLKPELARIGIPEIRKTDWFARKESSLFSSCW